MSTTTQTPATIDDLYQVEGKAELIDGRIVHFMSSGLKPSRVALKISIRLEAYSERIGLGLAFSDGMGYSIDPPLANGRQSFSPDASYYSGPLPENDMWFIKGAPSFAVEVRSENDYGPSAEAEMQAKRADYFEARTQVVWDVDPMARTIAVYRSDPVIPSMVYGPGQLAEAEPALPGWLLAVDDLLK